MSLIPCLLSYSLLWGATAGRVYLSVRLLLFGDLLLLELLLEPFPFPLPLLFGDLLFLLLLFDPLPLPLPLGDLLDLLLLLFSWRAFCSSSPTASCDTFARTLRLFGDLLPLDFDPLPLPLPLLFGDLLFLDPPLPFPFELLLFDPLPLPFGDLLLFEEPFNSRTRPS